MSIVVRTDEEINEMLNQAAEAFDEGIPGAGMVMEVLEYLTDEDASKPRLNV